MTDFASDKENGEHDAAAGPAQEPVETETTVFEEGLAIHIVEPDDPGTIFVAVAEPTDIFENSPGGDDAEERGETAEYFPAETENGAPEDTDTASLAVDIPQYGDLVEVAAVRLGGLGPALFFLAGGVSCAAGDNVVVTMEEGHVYGCVASVLRVHPDHAATLPGENGEGSKLRPVVRKATEKDDASAANNDVLASEALEYCRQCIRERDLDMKLVDVLVLHDRGKMVFYFTAPARIDFRELVKDLVRRYRTRIELRQIGVRHETQMVGALGNCGMVCCCRRYLRKFAPVAIKMAKEQNVFLNPVKISGICGRLLCCLAYEQEHYDEFYRSCPKLGKKYHTDTGVYRILRASLFRESVTVLSETGEEVEFPLAEWNALNPFRPNVPQQSQNGSRQQGGKPSGEDKPRRNGKPEKPHREKHVPRVPQEAADAIKADVTGSAEADATGLEVFAEEADFETGDEPGGGSIFGLSPRRETRQGSNSAENAAERKRPLKRPGRGKNSSDS